MNPPALSARRPLAAFTLIELLVVIIIIAILAALIIPISNSMLAQARSTKCTSNLREIGKGILSYCTEHEDTLPGPLTAEQYPNPTAGAKGSLAVLLSPYLGGEDKTKSGGNAAQGTEINRNNLFLCPAYERQFPKADGIVYLANLRKMKQYGQPVWGDAGQDQEPLRKSVLTTWTADTAEGKDQPVELSKTFALRDTDQLDRPEDDAPQANGLLAPKPFHGEHRNVLYFDFHVGKVDKDTNLPK